VNGIAVRPAAECQYDAVALGEVMLRLDPGESRVRSAREFRVSEGGGEYNVVRGLSTAFGLRTAVVTAFVDNEIGRLLESLVRGGGVDPSWIRWAPYDGVGRSARNGLNFTERGFGVRPPLGVADRGHSAASQLAPDDVDWEKLFADQGARWLHTGGIFVGLSDMTASTAAAAMTSARRHGAVVSYDLNHRDSLWPGPDGADRARAVHRALAEQVDVLVGNVGHLRALLDEDVGDLDELMTELATAFPSLQLVAATDRVMHSASRHDWGAAGWSRAEGMAHARTRRKVEVLDRVGGGDAFVSGLVHGLLGGRSLTESLELGTAHGALVLTTPGDTSMASAAEVETLAEGKSGKFMR
jgi:2-dehydro-3-deoxygluconokinase